MALDATCSHVRPGSAMAAARTLALCVFLLSLNRTNFSGRQTKGRPGTQWMFAGLIFSLERSLIHLHPIRGSGSKAWSIMKCLCIQGCQWCMLYCEQSMGPIMTRRCTGGAKPCGQNCCHCKEMVTGTEIGPADHSSVIVNKWMETISNPPHLRHLNPTLQAQTVALLPSPR